MTGSQHLQDPGREEVPAAGAASSAPRSEPATPQAATPKAKGGKKGDKNAKDSRTQPLRLQAPPRTLQPIRIPKVTKDRRVPKAKREQLLHCAAW